MTKKRITWQEIQRLREIRAALQREKHEEEHKKEMRRIEEFYEEKLDRMHARARREGLI